MRHHLISLDSSEELLPEHLERMQIGDYILLEWSTRLLIKRWFGCWKVYDVDHLKSLDIKVIVDNIKDNSELALCKTVEEVKTAIMDDWMLK